MRPQSNVPKNARPLSLSVADARSDRGTERTAASASAARSARASTSPAADGIGSTRAPARRETETDHRRHVHYTSRFYISPRLMVLGDT